MDTKPKPKAPKARIVTCSWQAAPFETNLKCGWTGRSDKYQRHLDLKHGGKDYSEPKVGL